MQKNVVMLLNIFFSRLQTNTLASANISMMLSEGRSMLPNITKAFVAFVCTLNQPNYTQSCKTTTV